MFVVFEGIDGGGKTTLSNLVAERLRAGGLRVKHVREGGKFASRVTQAMRELGRDSRNLALTPRAELMLYLTRDVQLAEEATKPALARADVVIADRFVYTAEVLAVYGRMMLEADVAPLVAAATDLVPQLVVLVDVDPQVARARRQVSKLVAKEIKAPSRKGLAGTALQHRLRAGYRELAARDPGRWVVVDNTEADLEATTDALVAVIREAAAGGTSARARLVTPPPPLLAAHDLASAQSALLAWIDRRSAREPGLAAYFLDGVPGPEFDARRDALADRAPAVVAAGLRWLVDAPAWRLRHRLADVAPAEVASSLEGPAAAHPDATPLLRALAPRAPLAVGRALRGRVDDIAWELRDMLPGEAQMLSLARVPGPRGWELRERWQTQHADQLEEDVLLAASAAASIVGLGDDRAWALREELLDVAPVAAIESLQQVVDERAWEWRERYLERAPKVVMKTLFGVDDPRAWHLRERAAVHCEEAIDSLAGLDGDRAYALRTAALDRWPATVVRSLGLLARTERGAALVAEALARHPHNVALWRQALIRSSAATPDHRDLPPAS